MPSPYIEQGIDPKRPPPWNTHALWTINKWNGREGWVGMGCGAEKGSRRTGWIILFLIGYILIRKYMADDEA